MHDSSKYSHPFNLNERHSFVAIAQGQAVNLLSTLGGLLSYEGNEGRRMYLLPLGWKRWGHILSGAKLGR